MEKFLVAVIGSDPKLKVAFEKIKETKIRNKTFEFEHFNDSNFDPERYALIFISKKKRALNLQIFNQVNGALIITNYRTPDEERMVKLFNLTDLDEQNKIKLNRRIQLHLNKFNLCAVNLENVRDKFNLNLISLFE